MWRDCPIKAPIRPILVWDGNPHWSVGLVATKGDFEISQKVDPILINSLFLRYDGYEAKRKCNLINVSN